MRDDDERTGLQEFGMENFDLIQGGVAAEIVRTMLMQGGNDCRQRPGEAGARTTTITFTQVPVIDKASGKHLKNEVQIAFANKFPAQRLSPISVACKANGMLMFNPDSLDNVDQTTIFDGRRDD